MGMYTEIVANFPLVDDVPEIVVDVLNYLSGNTENMPENIPEHGFFTVLGSKRTKRFTSTSLK